MYLTAIFILKFFLACNTLKVVFLTHQYYLNIVLDLKNHYKSGCLVIVYSDELKTGYQAVEWNKILSSHETMVVHLPVHKLQKTAEEFRCKRNRPLYVVFDNSNTRKYLRMLSRVPSYPRWLLIVERPSPTNDRFLGGMYVPFNCEFLVAENFGSSIMLSEVYQVAVGWSLNKLRFGSWSQKDGLEFVTNFLYNRRFNLEGLVLRAVTIRYIFPEAFLVSDSKQRLSQMDLYGKIWLSLEERYNFTTVIRESPNNGFGFLSNGSWNGMMSTIVNKEADLALAPFSYDYERLKAVDFLATFSHTLVYLVVKMPSTTQFQWASFLSPFSSILWLSILSSIFLFGISLSMVHRAGQVKGVKHRRGDNKLPLPGALFHVFGLFCTQAPALEPNGQCARTVLLLAGFTTVVIAAAYSGALTSFITVQKLDLPHETIEEYVDDPTYQLEMSQNGFWLYVNNPRIDFYRKLYNRMENIVDDMPTNKLSGLNKICDRNKFGWFGSFKPNDKFTKMVKCEITAVPGHMLIDSESAVLTKRSPYTKLFNRKYDTTLKKPISNSIHYLHWSGLLDRFVRNSGLKKEKNGTEKQTSVNFQQVVPIIAILFLGIAGSIMTVVVEILIFKLTCSGGNMRKCVSLKTSEPVILH